MKVAVVIVAAGSGKRMGTSTNKVLLELDGKPIIYYSLHCFAAMPEITEIVLVAREEDLDDLAGVVQDVGPRQRCQIVLGGAERQESVFLGLKALPADTNWVLIHDGARPRINAELVRKILEAARRYRAAGAAVPVKDTIKRVNDHQVVETLPRTELWAMQTPQAFAYELILKAHEHAFKEAVQGTDDCALVERLGEAVQIVPGDYANLKITTPEDLPSQEVFLVGLGFDVHRLVGGRPLILAGIEIPSDRGLLGHSDADVVIHALMDALLGAMGRGDIGELFPDTDPNYAGISSTVLLKRVLEIAGQERLVINNLDLTIMAQEPKLKPWKAAMRANLAQICGIAEDKLNVKATTTEGLGFVGKGEGMAAQAVVSLRAGSI